MDRTIGEEDRGFDMAETRDPEQVVAGTSVKRERDLLTISGRRWVDYPATVYIAVR